MVRSFIEKINSWICCYIQNPSTTSLYICFKSDIKERREWNVKIHSSFKKTFLNLFSYSFVTNHIILKVLYMHDKFSSFLVCMYENLFNYCQLYLTLIYRSVDRVLLGLFLPLKYLLNVSLFFKYLSSLYRFVHIKDKFFLSYIKKHFKFNGMLKEPGHKL